MEKGWVKLHRKIKRSAFYKRSSYVHLWLHLLLSANHEPQQFMWNNTVIVIKEGELITGRKALSEDTGIPQTTVEDILNFLETQHQIRQQKTTKYRLITIVNWKNYQESDSVSDNRATTERHKQEYKEYKEVIRVSEETPSFQEYLEELGVTTDYEGDGEVSEQVYRLNGKKISVKRLTADYDKLYKTPEEAPKRPLNASRTHDSFDFDSWLIKLSNSSYKPERIVAAIWKRKGYKFENYEQWRAQLDKDAVYAKKLVGYSGPQIEQAVGLCEEEATRAGYDWGVSTVWKKIAKVTI